MLVRANVYVDRWRVYRKEAGTRPASCGSYTGVHEEAD